MEEHRFIKGNTFGHFEIDARIGAGGMGEVYRARDKRLNRDVALKVLPQAFLGDPQRMGRFEREAQMLASLNHPNIAQIYGLEEVALNEPSAERAGGFSNTRSPHDIKVLVMELVDGEDLSVRLSRGPIPVDEALAIARQIAEGLEEAHERGIIHRDLKPANIKVSSEGKVKILDFGLAKALESPSSSIDTDLSKSPTLSVAATEVGMILGTAGYMAPEQARGRAVDRRADIWAFGTILFEMISGRRLFKGEDLTETLASVIRDEPDWGLLPSGVPPRLEMLLRRCLAKDPKVRLRDIGDARLELIDSGDADAFRIAPATPNRVKLLIPWLALAAVSIAFLAWVYWTPGQAVEMRVARVHLGFPEEHPIALGRQPSFSLSPDGGRIVYVTGEDSEAVLQVRDLDHYESRLVPGTQGASGPFFSPDGRSIGFFAGGKLKRVDLSGGLPVTLASVSRGMGASWGTDDKIVYCSESGDGLFRVAATGGNSEEATTLNREEADWAHTWPTILPDGSILYTIQSYNLEMHRLAVQPADGSPRRILLENAGLTAYLDGVGDASGERLIFFRNGVLFSVPFDSKSYEIRGQPVPVVEGVRGMANSGGAHLSVSKSGSLLYAPGTASFELFSLVWVDRNGVSTPITGELRGFEDLHLSPDGTKITLTIDEEVAQVHIYDISRDAWTRFVPEGESRDPIWTPDGRYVTYGVKRDGIFGIFRKPVDGSGPEEPVIINKRSEWLDPISWSSDGKVLFFDRPDPEMNDGIWMVEVGGEPTPFVDTPGYEMGPRVSPNGKWVGYNSVNAGDSEVYVKPYPDMGGRWQISTQGGYNPIWSRDGSELFYRTGESMMRVPVKIDPTFVAGKPEVLFTGRYRSTGRDFDISTDGRRFIMMKPAAPPTVAQLNLIIGWSRELN